MFIVLRIDKQSLDKIDRSLDKQFPILLGHLSHSGDLLL